uniref:GTD-binding domain-containing protein n=1 Tax=Cannabis sativa TaxID=3483 RepID=A0A803QAW3_CANSA
MCMAEESTFSEMSETDIIVLKDTLQLQQQLLQKLYAELDQEREASASAASEALSMILRLQGEKAAVKMEANQYKRLAEEKICHAEESLAIFEDLIYSKEMEIASLEFQVQAYKCRLLSLGFSDMVAVESKFPENLLIQGSDLWKGDSCVVGGGGNVKRFSSLPPIPIKDFHSKKNSLEQEKSVDSSGGSFSSFWQQIKMLDEQVREISNGRDSGREKATKSKSGSRSCSLPPPVTISSTSVDFSRLETVNSLDQVNRADNRREEEEIVVTTSCSSSVQDIYEVPKLKENHNIREQQNKAQSKLIEEAEIKLEKLDFMSEETSNFCVQDEKDCVKTMLHCSKDGRNLSIPNDEMSIKCNVTMVHPTIGVSESQAKFQQLCRRVDRIEGENSASQEITSAGTATLLALINKFNRMVPFREMLKRSRLHQFQTGCAHLH